MHVARELIDAHNNEFTQQNNLKHPNMRFCNATSQIVVGKAKELIDVEPSADGKVLIQGLKPM